MRRVVAGGVALLLGVAVLRAGLVEALADGHPNAAARVWPSHPLGGMQAALVRIGQAAAAGQFPPPDAIAEVKAGLASAPLSAQPFLVAGTDAVAHGDAAGAERLFAEAERRDPRNGAARYFLATRYLSTGRDLDGLKELAALGRLVPNADTLVGAAISSYLQAGHASGALQALLDRNPVLKDQVLATLSQNADNAALVTQMAGPPAPGQPAPGWVGNLALSLVAKGRFAEAYASWSRMTGKAGAPGGLYNGNFADRATPPPFNWLANQNEAGLAELTDTGLSIVYYGRTDSSLASQVLLLKPGRYRIESTSDGNGQGALAWSLACLPAGNAVMSFPLQPDQQRAVFAVPAGNCAAQRLELLGKATGTSSTISANVTRVAISPEAGQ